MSPKNTLLTFHLPDHISSSLDTVYVYTRDGINLDKAVMHSSSLPPERLSSLLGSDIHSTKIVWQLLSNLAANMIDWGVLGSHVSKSKWDTLGK